MDAQARSRNDASFRCNLTSSAALVAGVAVDAVVDVAGDAAVFRVGLGGGVAAGALEDGIIR